MNRTRSHACPYWCACRNWVHTLGDHDACLSGFGSGLCERHHVNRTKSTSRVLPVTGETNLSIQDALEIPHLKV